LFFFLTIQRQVNAQESANLEQSLAALSALATGQRLSFNSMEKPQLRLLWELYDIPYLFLTRILPQNLIRRKILENFISLIREDAVFI
jgi:hypothetical protein